MDPHDPAPIFGKLALLTGKKLAVTVCRSRAGFYLGTIDADGLPCSRESAEYWRESETAQQALARGQWTQRPYP